MMKRENKQYNWIAIIGLVLMLVIILSIGSISALTAKIGNGKVVLNANVGDIIEKSVKVINSNNVSIIIELSGGGDLKDQFKFQDNNFTLAPNEETDAEYSLRVTKEGRTDSQINVMFTPLEGKNGIVLPASIIIFAAKGNNTTTSWTDRITGNSNNNSIDTNTTDDNPDSKQNIKINPLVIGLFITAIIFVILLVLLSLYLKNKGGVKLNNKKRQ